MSFICFSEALLGFASTFRLLCSSGRQETGFYEHRIYLDDRSAVSQKQLLDTDVHINFPSVSASHDDRIILMKCFVFLC